MDRLPTDQLAAIDEALEVDIETRRAVDAPSHRVTIWVVVDADEVFVRSVRGTRGRWFRELMAHPDATLHVDRRAIEVRGVLADDARSVDRCSNALRSKYARDPSLRSMLRAEVLPTTVKLVPR